VQARTAAVSDCAAALQEWGKPLAYKQQAAHEMLRDATAAAVRALILKSGF
jgi:hypothetical protein